jgi:hypothetical protein
MGNYSDIVHSLPEDRDVMEELTTLTDTFIESVKATHPQKYTNFMQQLKGISTSHHFDEHSLKEALQHVGTYINHEESSKLAEVEFAVDFHKEPFNKCDFNFIMNYMYHQFHHLYNDNWAEYVKLALSWLDVNHGKAKTFYEKLFK